MLALYGVMLAAMVVAGICLVVVLWFQDRHERREVERASR